MRDYRAKPGQQPQRRLQLRLRLLFNAPHPRRSQDCVPVSELLFITVPEAPWIECNVNIYSNVVIFLQMSCRFVLSLPPLLFSFHHNSRSSSIHWTLLDLYMKVSMHYGCISVLVSPFMHALSSFLSHCIATKPANASFQIHEMMHRQRHKTCIHLARLF